MLKKFLIIGATGGLMMSTALAQQTPAPAADTAAKPAPTSSAKFLQTQSADQWAWSKFKGTDVIGANNEKIGDVDDILFDKNNKVMAYVVGVGGFLGIGQKNVAIDPSAFQVVPASTTTGSTAGSTANTATTNTMASDNDPTHVKLKVSWTKDELKNAPAFEYYKAPARTTTAPAGTNTGAARPAPANPPATNR